MTFTKLVVGTPRWPVRPPRGNPSPCSDTVVTGASLLGDGGFENWDSLHGRTEFPERSGPGGLLTWPSDGTTAATWEHGGDISPLYWHGSDGSAFDGSDAYWQLSTANPDVGTYHARVVMDSGSARLWPNVHMHCAEPDTTLFSNWHIWPVTSGLTVDVSARAMADNVNGQGQLTLFITGWDSTMENDSFIGSFTIENLTTSYATYTKTETVPSGISYVQIIVRAAVLQSPAPTGDVTIDLDEVTLGIT